MRTLNELELNIRINIKEIGMDGGYAFVYWQGVTNPIKVIFSWGDGWDHISASRSTRTCTWEEMNFIKNIFFKDDECVVQYHPPTKDNINVHPFCLHLWRPQYQKMPMPPKYMIG